MSDADHRDLLWRGELDARLLHPAGWPRSVFNMQLGEVVFGGVGTGLYSMLIFAIVGVFIAGLMGG